MSAPRILAIDLATVGAAAWTGSELGRVDTMHFDLRERAQVTKAQISKAHGRIFFELHDLVRDLIDRVKPDVVAVEKDFGRGYHVLVMLGGLRAVAELAAAQAGIRCITDIDASTARSLAGVGGGSTSKETAGGRARMFFGLPTQTADEVDAVILLKAVEARLREEAMEARLKAAAKAAKRPSRRAA